MIYCATSEKAYIGQTKHLQKRLYQHKWKLNKGTHPNPHLQNAYKKYGEAYFNFILLENCAHSELTAKEAEWLDKIDIELRYNINKVTDVHPVSEETRKKISDRVVTKETRELLSKAKIGKKWSEEQKNKLSKSRKGVKKSEETKAKMKEAQKRRGVEWREKLSIANKGKRPSEECIKAVIESNKNRKISDEARKKKSEAMMGNKLWALRDS